MRLLAFRKRLNIMRMKGGLRMDQIKVGAFLKGLRKEKGITQEQFADTLFFYIWS